MQQIGYFWDTILSALELISNNMRLIEQFVQYLVQFGQ